MLNRLMLKVTKFQVPPPKRLGTVVKNILGSSWPPPPFQIELTGIRFHGPTSCLHRNDDNDHEKATYLNTQSKVD